MTWSNHKGKLDAPIAFIFEPGVLASQGAKDLIRGTLRENGFDPNETCSFFAYPDMPKSMQGSESKEGAWINEHRPQFLESIRRSGAKLGVAFGKGATRACSGKAVKITRVRGQVWEYPELNFPVLTSYGPSHVLRRPELLEIFTTDMQAMRRFADAGWALDDFMKGGLETNYRWCLDLQFLLDMEPEVIALDTETTGLDWYRPEVRPLTVQFSWAPGEAVAVPLDREFWPEMTRNQARLIKSQVAKILANPRMKKVAHNMSYDHHILTRAGFDVQGWHRDTLLSAFTADDNMQDKSLDECVRRWVPAMAGYNDEHNRTIDKSDMLHVPRDQFLSYACGDADADLRLYHALEPIIRRDGRQTHLLETVQMPALRAFATAVEDYGVAINTDELANLGDVLQESYDQIYAELIAAVPAAVKRKHAEKGLKFTRDDFVRDILFSKEGFGIKPLMWTKSTANSENKEDRVPSIDAKNHLAYFEDNEWVVRYREFSQIDKMRTTYVGRQHDEKKNGPTGFWKYMHNGVIHPTFNLHSTVTGRTASRNPNAQNFPKRGELAAAYRRVFIAREGYTLIEADLSQAELRIAAWMANEVTMLAVYQRDGDIHSETAAAITGVPIEVFMSWEGNDTLLLDVANSIPGSGSYLSKLAPGERRTTTLGDYFEQLRFQAKAVNFGFLYGMGWRKFRVYAKTQYGVDYTEEEAQQIRVAFFRKYPGLAIWHKNIETFVRDHGYVRSLHGALRRLPSVYSSEETMQWSAIRQAVNSPVQRFASDLGLIALGRLVRDAPPTELRPLMFVHDALVLEARTEDLQQHASAVKFYMETAPLKPMFNITAPLPIKADVKVGPNLADLEKRKWGAVAPEWYDAEADRLNYVLA